MQIIYMLLAVFALLKINKIKTFFIHLAQFARWVSIDIKRALKNKKLGIKKFREYGVTMFTGRQGSGKTTSMVNRLNELHKEYPKALIYTNFRYKYATGRLESLNDLLTIRNGMDGVIFAITEIQNEFSSNTSKDFPESLLSTITMQRKQCVKILCDSQVYTRVSKPLREQCYEVIECRTLMTRWTRNRCYDADDYNMMVDQTDINKRMKIRRKWRRSFVQSDDLRDCFDTLEVIPRLSRQGFAPKIREK